jgi:hypothetical protein
VQPASCDRRARDLGLNPKKNPDALINARVFDVYSPTSKTVLGVHHERLHLCYLVFLVNRALPAILRRDGHIWRDRKDYFWMPPDLVPLTFPDEWKTLPRF